tara:strand:- start:49 stop:279 length:231 start_codon:yes stop_codon:yes gene_type:complete
MSLSKKHFIKIAEIISNNKASNFTNPLSQKISLIDNLGDYFRSENKNFDKDKFSAACLGGGHIVTSNGIPEIKGGK